MIYAHETASLAVDADGVLWAKLWYAPDVELGAIEREPDVPAGLVGERAELLDWWRDRADERAEWRDAYYRDLFRAG